MALHSDRFADMTPDAGHAMRKLIGDAREEHTGMTGVTTTS